MKVFVTVILLALASSLLFPSITLATKFCPECNKTYSDNYSFCEDCGAKLLVLGWTCPNCGAMVEEGKLKCPVCFTKKPGTEETYTPEPQTEKPPVTIPEKPQEETYLPKPGTEKPPTHTIEKPKVETKYTLEEKRDLRKGFMVIARGGAILYKGGYKEYPVGLTFGYGLIGFSFARVFVGLGGEYIHTLYGANYSAYAETRFFFFPQSRTSPNVFLDLGILQAWGKTLPKAIVGAGVEYRLFKHFGVSADVGLCEVYYSGHLYDSFVGTIGLMYIF